MKEANYDAAIEARKSHPIPGVSHDFLIFIGRFQPFHLGHREVIVQALKQATNVVILIGSANAPRSYRNPWTFLEREEMIRGSFDAYSNDRLFILPLEDVMYNNTAWVRQVQASVDDVVREKHDFAADPRIGLIGHNKDNTSYYLKLFPQWSSVNVANFLDLAATVMREGVFSNIAESWLHASTDILPSNVMEQIRAFSTTEEYRDALAEFEFIRNYRQAWVESPHAPTFVTTDAVVVQSGNILLVRRGARPGKGLLALPGGFLKDDETILDGMLRELREETHIRVADGVLRRLADAYEPKVFDDPHRDPRGRFITHAYLIHLEPRAEEGFKLPAIKGGGDAILYERGVLQRQYKLPAVKGSDDAADAIWLPLNQVKRQDMFLDHYDIISHLVARL